jgi:hypothetical protein
LLRRIATLASVPRAGSEPCPVRRTVVDWR